MNIDQIKILLTDAFPDAEIEVDGDGYHHNVLIISEQFENVSLVERQKSVYKVLASYIQSGELHALSIKAKTPNETQSN